MAPPTKDKTWNYSFTQIPSSSIISQAQLTMLQLVNDWIGLGTNPWVVHYSCDGTTAGADGDGVNRWTLTSDLVWATGAHSWIVLQRTDGVEFLIDLDRSSAQAYDAYFYVSVTDGFTGGTTTARPTATDERAIGDSSPQRWTRSSVGSSVLWVQQSDDGLVSRWHIVAEDNPAAFGCIEDVKNPTSGAALSLLCTVDGSGSAVSDTTEPDQLAVIGTPFAHEYSTGFGWTDACFMGWGLSTGLIAADAAHPEERTGEPFFSQIGIWGTTAGQRGPKGVRYDIYWVPSPPANTGDTAPAGLAREWASFGHMLLPHDGSVPVTT